MRPYYKKTGSDVAKALHQTPFHRIWKTYSAAFPSASTCPADNGPIQNLMAEMSIGLISPSLSQKRNAPCSAIVYLSNADEAAVASMPST